MTGSEEEHLDLGVPLPPALSPAATLGELPHHVTHHNLHVFFPNNH